MLKTINNKIVKTFGHITYGYVLIAFVFLTSNLYICHQISRSRSVIGIGLIVITILTILYLISKLLLARKTINEHHVFLMFLIFQGLMYMAVFLPVTIPDEVYHFLNTYRYSNLLLLQPFGDTSFLMRESDIEFTNTYSIYMNAENYSTTLHELSLIAADSSLTEYPFREFNISSNLPQVRLAGAIGIALGRLFNLGAIPVFYLGRLFNFAFFVLLVYLAVKYIPIGKRIMMMICMLPMTLHLGASYSYDAGIIGMTFLLTALLLKAIYSAEPLSRRLKAAILILAFLLGPCKVIYSMVIFLVLFIPLEKFTSRKEAIIYKSSIFIVVLLSVLILKLGWITAAASAESGSSNETYTLSNVFDNPKAFVSILFNTLNNMGDFYINTMIGGCLGWLQGSIGANWYMVLGFIILILLSTIRNKDTSIKPTIFQRTAFFMITFVGIVLSVIALYFDWTPNTATVIEGVQGRYFLPLLPLMLLAFQGSAVQTTRNISLPIIYTATAFNAAYITKIYAMALVA